jgi:hypothetical protein
VIFTLWSRGSLLGELELTDHPGGTRALVGPFRPTDAGRAMLPVFLDAQTALTAIGPMLERRGITRERLGAALGQAVHEALHESPEGQRVAQTRATLDALVLELHDGTDTPVPMRQITIQDVWSAGSAAEPPVDARTSIEAAGLPQYVAAVTLMDPRSASRPST